MNNDRLSLFLGYNTHSALMHNFLFCSFERCNIKNNCITVIYLKYIIVISGCKYNQVKSVIQFCESHKCFCWSGKNLVFLRFPTAFSQFKHEMDIQVFVAIF